MTLRPASSAVRSRPATRAGSAGPRVRSVGRRPESREAEQTAGLSVQAILTNEGGWLAAGWRHATAAEVCGLLAQDAAAPVPCPGSGFVGVLP